MQKVYVRKKYNTIKSFDKIKRYIREIPLLGHVLVRIALLLGYRKKIEPFVFVRKPIPNSIENKEMQALIQVKNLLEYTKLSGHFYAAANFPAGYHTLEIFGEVFQGRRNPRKRFQNIEYDFNNRTVLDIGSNQGGMLFELADKIKWGVGIDYDSRMINAALKIRALQGHNHLDFYHFNLEKEPLPLIYDLMPEPKVDIVFLLAVCRWIKNWREVITFASEISDNLLIETNGATEQEQKAQKDFFTDIYKHIVLISDNSRDDPERSDRKLYLCKK